MARRLLRVSLIVTASIFGLCAGCMGSYASSYPWQPSDYSFLAESVPLPHHVPQHPGGLSLRFAMVHDVIHERYPKHGRAHYEERNRLTRQKLATLAPDDAAAFPLADDLAAGLERLGKPEEAVVVMRDKLARQQAKGLAGKDLYTSYANLGTFQAHAALPKAVAGDFSERERFRDGIEFVKKSVEVNPQAHFGREEWQVALAEFLLTVTYDSGCLRKFDFLGNRLDLAIEDMLNREQNWTQTGYGRATTPQFSQGRATHEVPAFFEPDAHTDDPAQWEKLRAIRVHITKVGAEYGWEKIPSLSHREPVAFDAPVMGIVGMWRQGGGANPHFALALGEVMLRVGQRHIAWCAFERAYRLADRFWPNPGDQEFLRQHCRKRQGEIEETLTHPPSTNSRRPAWQNVSPPLSPAEVAELRPRFEAELAYGEGYQRAYQEYDAKQIAAGMPITDEHYFDAFNAGREPIASPVGPEERFVWVPQSKIAEYKARRAWAWGTFGAGLLAVLVAVPLWRRGRRQP